MIFYIYVVLAIGSDSFDLAQRADLFAAKPLSDALAVKQVAALQLGSTAAIFKLAVAHSTLLLTMLFTNVLPTAKLLHLLLRQALRNVSYLFT
jgi:hypothetical protein